jgi:hypothetical protein
VYFKGLCRRQRMQRAGWADCNRKECRQQSVVLELEAWKCLFLDHGGNCLGVGDLGAS